MVKVKMAWRAALLGGMVVAGLLVLATLPVAAAGQDRSGELARVVELTNVERQTAGLEPLVLSRQLTDAAQNYSQVLASGTCFEHTCGAVPDFGDRLREAGYTGWTGIAENIAAGYPSPDAVVAGWMASPGHRANILSPKYREIGVGVVSGGRYGTYWTQEFGLRPAGLMDGSAPPMPDQPAEDPAPGDEEPPPEE
jgi:uncharacterized protein YkwD